MAQDLAGLSTLFDEFEDLYVDLINLNGGNFDSGEVEALRRLFDKLEVVHDKIYTELSELDSRVTTLEP